MALTATDVLDWLAAEGTEAERQAMLRYAIPNDTAYGVPMGQLLAYARKRPKDPALAVALWQSGRYEARCLAVLLDDPQALSADRMDRMVGDFDSWAICDTAAFHLLDRTGHAWDALPRYATNPALYTRRTAFALLWALALHDRSAPGQRFIEALTLCEDHAADPRPHVAKAITMALRAIGRKGEDHRAACRALGQRLAGKGKPEAAQARQIARMFP